MILRSNGVVQVRQYSARASQTLLTTVPETRSLASGSKPVAFRTDSVFGTRASYHGRSVYREPSTVSGSPIYARRAFTISTGLQKQKKGRSFYDDGVEQEDQKNNGGSRRKDGQAIDSSTGPVSDAINLTTFKTDVQQVQEKLKKRLSGLKPGGRFDPALIETLRVDVTKLQHNDDAAQEKLHARAIQDQQSSSDAKKGKVKTTKGFLHAKPVFTVALTETAQVIPRGAKTIIIMLNEEAFAKPVISALLGSRYSLNPSVSPTNPLELIVPIPPPTAELRAHTLSQVDKLRERAESDLRDRRAGMQKELRTLQLSNQVGPDAHHSTLKKMEKVMDEMKAEIKRLCDASRKVLQQS